jgi:diguanylate cyclase (GGDEF)-like protein
VGYVSRASTVPVLEFTQNQVADPALRPSLSPDGGVRSSQRPAVAPDGRVKILIADDDRLSRESLSTHISRWGYDVETVGDGGAAFSALLRPSAPRLALVDWEMPALSGIDVCRLLRARSDAPYIYIILCTSKERQRHLIDGLAAGADDYIRKPFDLQELEVRLRAGRRIVLLQDQLLEVQAELERRALYDRLTDVKNRGAILDVLASELARAEQTGKPVSIVLADLDFFKRINDTHGHPVGDAVLREFAKSLRATLRFSDEVGRYGGEEFLLVLPDCASTEALVMAERVRRAVAGTAVDVSSETVSVTASFGVAGTDQGHRNATSLIAAADAALYSAKALGRNRTAVAPGHATGAATP